MPDAAPDDELDRLVAGHLDEALDAADTERLSARLRTDVAARRLLLAAATQASALPRLGLEATTRAPRPVAAHPTSRWVAVAAVLLVVAGWWLSPWWLSPLLVETRATGTGTHVVVEERDGRPHTPLIDDGALRSGVGPLVVRWLTEDTRIELAPHSRMRVEESGAHKRLVLETGGLRASVAPQPADGGLQVVTPHGRIDVVGTSFTVEVQERESRVVVTHGVVRVAAGEALTTVPLSAGYEVKVTPTAVSAPGPMAEWPMPAPTAAPRGPLVTKRLTAADFATGGEGEVVDGQVRAVAVAGVRRLTTPLHRPGGHVWLSDRFQANLRVTVDQPTTLALLLVCDDRAGGSQWVGNLQGELRIPAGTQELTFTHADLRPATGALVPNGSLVVAVAVMSWGPSVDLRLEWIDLIR